MWSANRPIRDWRKERVWIVGASSGIGRALAHELHGLGAQVIVSARREGLLQEFVRTHPGSHMTVLDVADTASLEQTWQMFSTGSESQAPSLICYCVGDYEPMSVVELDAKKCQTQMHTNYMACVNLVQLLMPYLLSQRAHFSVMGSVAAYSGLPRSIAYGPSKAALLHLAEILYLELSPKGVPVSLLSPGFVATALTDKNQFTMPALMSATEAAKAIIAGWEKGLFEIHFPKRLSIVLKLARLLPFRLYFALIKKSIRS